MPRDGLLHGGFLSPDLSFSNVHAEGGSQCAAVAGALALKTAFQRVVKISHFTFVVNVSRDFDS